MSRTLKYRGYEGSVLYSEEDRLLHGRIIGIHDMVSFEGTDVDGLENCFREAVDEYLAFCATQGKAPDVPFKGSFNVRINSDLHHRAVRFAEEHDLKLNNVVADALKDYLARSA